MIINFAFSIKYYMYYISTKITNLSSDLNGYFNIMLKQMKNICDTCDNSITYYACINHKTMQTMVWVFTEQNTYQHNIFERFWKGFYMTILYLPKLRIKFVCSRCIQYTLNIYNPVKLKTQHRFYNVHKTHTFLQHIVKIYRPHYTSCNSKYCQ